MNIRIAGTVNDSIVDGPGLRFAVFTQGCIHGCEGCHNPQTHDFSGGVEADTDEIAENFKKNSLLDGITLTGGEPFCQSVPCTFLASAAHENGLNVVTYTGYLFEELLLSSDPGIKNLLFCTDILIDGKFEKSKQSYSLAYKGSSNQRIIDVAESINTGQIVILDL